MRGDRLFVLCHWLLSPWWREGRVQVRRNEIVHRQNVDCWYDRLDCARCGRDFSCVYAGLQMVRQLFGRSGLLGKLPLIATAETPKAAFRLSAPETCLARASRKARA